MFTDILKIVPKIDDAEMRKMQTQLQSRFSKIAKSFGKGIANAFKGGGIAAIGLSLIDKVLNPLKETQEAIDRMLKTSDDIATNATQFNTSTGKLFKLVQLGKAQGLDQDNLFQLITKFQTAVAEAKADPSKDSAVRQFTGVEDTAEGFFTFIQSLQKMNRNDQLLVQQQVFGEKQILKMAEFLQSDFPQILKDTGLGKASDVGLGQNLDKLAGLEYKDRVNQVRRETGDVFTKGALINENMIKARDQAERANLARENQRIQSYTDLQNISNTTTQIMTLVEGGISMLGKLIGIVTPAMEKMTLALDKFMKSTLIRGVKSLFGKDE